MLLTENSNVLKGNTKLVRKRFLGESSKRGRYLCNNQVEERTKSDLFNMVNIHL